MLKKILTIPFVILIFTTNGCKDFNEDTSKDVSEPQDGIVFQDNKRIEMTQTEETSFDEKYENYIYPYDEDLEELLDKEPEYIYEQLHISLPKYYPVELLENDPETFIENFGNNISENEIQKIIELINLLNLHKNDKEKYTFNYSEEESRYMPEEFLIQNLNNINKIEFKPVNEEEKYLILVSEKEGGVEILNLNIIKNEQNSIKYIITEIQFYDESAGGIYNYNTEVILNYNEDGKLSEMLSKNIGAASTKDIPMLTYWEFEYENEEITLIRKWRCALEVNQLAIPRIGYYFSQSDTL